MSKSIYFPDEHGILRGYGTDQYMLTYAFRGEYLICIKEQYYHALMGLHNEGTISLMKNTDTFYDIKCCELETAIDYRTSFVVGLTELFIPRIERLLVKKGLITEEKKYKGKTEKVLWEYEGEGFKILERVNLTFSIRTKNNFVSVYVLPDGVLHICDGRRYDGYTKYGPFRPVCDYDDEDSVKYFEFALPIIEKQFKKKNPA